MRRAADDAATLELADALPTAWLAVGARALSRLALIALLCSACGAKSQLALAGAARDATPGAPIVDAAADSGDAPLDAPSDIPVDTLEAAPDAPPEESGICIESRLVAVPVTSIELLEAPLFIDQVMALRVLVEFPYRAGCEHPGPVTVDVLPGNATDLVSITAHVWQSDDPGPCLAGNAQRMLVLSDHPWISSPHLVVMDAAPGGTIKIDVGVAGAGSSDCSPRTPGQPCARDCQCEATTSSARCVPTAQSAGICAVPCNDNENCPEPTHTCSVAPTSTTPPWCCVGASDFCVTGDNCTFGRRCIDGRCRLAQDVDPRPCACGAECGLGQVCDGASGRCATPCTADATCPGIGGVQTSCVDGSCAFPP